LHVPFALQFMTHLINLIVAVGLQVYRVLMGITLYMTKVLSKFIFTQKAVVMPRNGFRLFMFMFDILSDASDFIGQMFD